MRNETRVIFNTYMSGIASANGVPSAASKFTVAPSIQQVLETKIQESSEFLSRINMVPVPEQSGEKLGLGIGSTIASTTDTTTTARVAVDPTNFDGTGYTCTQTNFDTAITYAKLDMWAKYSDFQARIRNAIIQQQGRDRMMIGFNGTSRAATSNRANNPLLQDVNIGWMQKHRTNAPSRVLSQIAQTGKVQVGDTIDEAHGYKNLDALVFDIINEMIDPWFRQDTQLVCIIGRKLLADKYFPLINKNQPNTEKMAADIILSSERVGGVPAMQVPFIPENALIVTRLDNLSIYWQEGTRRRTIIDEAPRDRIANYESSNEAYVVEDHGCMAMAENIEIVET
jgi:P2 family phage major capsid protein